MVFQTKVNYFFLFIFLFTLMVTITTPAPKNIFVVTNIIFGTLFILQNCITYRATIEKSGILYEHRFFTVTYKQQFLSADSIERFELHKDALKVFSRFGDDFFFSIHTREFLMEVESFAESNDIPFKLADSKKGIFFTKGGVR